MRNELLPFHVPDIENAEIEEVNQNRLMGTAVPINSINSY